MEFLEKNFRSRKFIITVVVTLAAFVMAAAEKMGSPLSMVLLSSVASYTAANAFVASSVETLEKYFSRKFLITLAIVLGSCLYAWLRTNGMQAAEGNVLTACIASYNGFNAFNAVMSKRNG